MANETLSAAKNAKKDEFYTQYADIQTDLEYNPDTFKDKTILLPCDDPEWSNFTRFFAQNFERLGLKKLISTSYATNSKSYYSGYQYKITDFITDFEKNSPQFNIEISPKRGKIFTLTSKTASKVDIDDLKWSYLEGDGDFRSDEVKRLRNEADIIVTNPPFSLFREFMGWLTESNKQFIIIGNQNAITYKEIFPLIMNNKLWLGKGFPGNVGFFGSVYDDIAAASEHKEGMIRVSGVMWFTNIEHGRRHQALSLMSMADNLKFSKHKDIREKGYQHYDNYDAIEVPYSDAIPGDYLGIMGVPITFLPKYCPEQFEILGMCENLDLYGLKTKVYTSQECRDRYFEIFGKKGTYDLNASGVINGYKVYQRILIRKKA